MPDQDRDSFVHLDHARSDDQHAAMQRIQARGDCPFCRGNLQKEHRQPIVLRRKHWLATRSQWPYPNTRLHLLFIALQHFERLCELPPEAITELFSMIQDVERTQQLRGMSIGIRSGDMEVTKATVRHLHVHLIVPEITDTSHPDYQRVTFKMG